ncbi:hypothetical protein ANN_10484 [Periplaneta americana]|uniref:Transposase Tc1-like domain-containing protein n=1 Tax=Periplaneta americana TaxID=6978 RepID=A0ABQ8TP44_PERAM|nr:hypothetical protein ANN_10484 [Periplaneta americana]
MLADFECNSGRKFVWLTGARTLVKGVGVKVHSETQTEFIEANVSYSEDAEVIGRIVPAIEARGLLAAGKHSKRKVSDENVERIREAFQRSPRKSIRQASVQLNIPPTTVHTVLHKRLRLRAYKLQLHQMITPNDKLERKRFAETMLDKVDDDDTFLTRVCFSDEATFHVSGKVNRHNCRIWGRKIQVS